MLASTTMVSCNEVAYTTTFALQMLHMHTSVAFAATFPHYELPGEEALPFIFNEMVHKLGREPQEPQS